MLTRWSTGIRQQRSWLTLSYSVLPFLLALAVMELFKMATFPHSLLREQAHEVPAVIRSNRGIELVHAAPGEFEAPGSRWDVMDCLNQNQESYRSTTWASAMSPRPAPLMVAGVWWSAKTASVPLTITTQLSAARLWQLKALCMQYPGPVSAVLYVGLLKGRVLREDGLLAFMVSQAEALFHAMERSGQCKLDLMLVREVFDDPEAKIWYPVNQLRNYARLQARTPLIAIVDADLLVSPVLVEELQKLAKRKQYLRSLVDKREKVVYVLPAFQVPNSVPREEAMTLADRAINLGKPELHGWYGKDYVVPFDPGKPGHAATNYTRWFSTADAYEVKYELRYEPWVMCDRRSVPWHDNTFKGYGLNKIMHLEHMSSLGYRFLVHPNAFLVHRAHRSTKAKRLVLTAKQAQKAATSVLATDVPDEAQEEDEDEEEEEEEEGKGDSGLGDRLPPGEGAAQSLGSGRQGAADGLGGEGQRRKLMGGALSDDSGGEAEGRSIGRGSQQQGLAWVGQQEGQDTVLSEGRRSAGNNARPKLDNGGDALRVHGSGGDALLLLGGGAQERGPGEQRSREVLGSARGAEGIQRADGRGVGRGLQGYGEQGDSAWGVDAAKQAGKAAHRAVRHGGVSTYSHTQKLGDEARRRIAEGTYDPRTDRALQACLQQLAWWRKA